MMNVFGVVLINYILSCHFYLRKQTPVSYTLLFCDIVHMKTVFFCPLGYRKSTCNEIQSTGWVETKLPDFGEWDTATVRRHSIQNRRVISKEEQCYQPGTRIHLKGAISLHIFVFCCCCSCLIVETCSRPKAENLLRKLLKWSKEKRFKSTPPLFFALDN